MQVRVRVCDVCGEVSRPTREYKVQRDDKATVGVDLCSRHAAPLEVFLAKREGSEPLPDVEEHEGRKELPVPRGTTRRRGSRVKVTSLEEIEAQKGK